MAGFNGITAQGQLKTNLIELTLQLFPSTYPPTSSSPSPALSIITPEDRDLGSARE
jgi:hypothetical protein